jgi:MFS superfamily sulfate permease-like transporter
MSWPWGVAAVSAFLPRHVLLGAVGGMGIFIATSAIEVGGEPPQRDLSQST